MKVLLVGDGAREHAMAAALIASPTCPRLYCLMNNRNPGLLKLASGYALGDVDSPKDVLDASKNFGVDYVVIGPEAANFSGVPDLLEENGIPCFGARRRLAEIERSKVALRRIMLREKIPGRIRFLAFSSRDDAVAYAAQNPENLVFKPSGQVGGKGVRLIEGDRVYLLSATESLKKSAAEAAEKFSLGLALDEKVLIEERVFGPEYTAHFFCDGSTFIPTPLVQDNKHAFNGIEGPETGGMGSISGPGMLLPFIDEEDASRAKDIVEKTVKAIQEEAMMTYCGVVAGQMMLGTGCWDIPLEFYSRFGDPEGVNVLNMLDLETGASFEEICSATISRRLGALKVRFKEVASVVWAIAPQGYPQRRDLAQGHPIDIDEAAILEEGCKVFYGSVDRDGDRIVTKGSRSLEIYADATDLQTAREKVARAVRHVRLGDGWRLFYRSDVGSRQLIDEWIEIAENARIASRHRESKGVLYRRIDFVPGKGKIVYEI
jgi:phosphoribosylamine--glycine ligase